MAQLALMEEDFGRSEDFVAVVEDKAVFVGVTKILEPGYFHLGAVLATIHVIDHLRSGAEPDQADLVFVADALNVGNERVAVFAGTGLVAGAVD